MNVNMIMHDAENVFALQRTRILHTRGSVVAFSASPVIYDIGVNMADDCEEEIFLLAYLHYTDEKLE
jgi:hypothetical protein